MKRNPIKHDDGKTDKRYSLSLEWCGYATKQKVLRFCGEWISICEDEKQAIEIAKEHKERGYKYE